MTISREDLLRLVHSWQETGDPEAGILLDAVQDFGISVDTPFGGHVPMLGNDYITIRWHLERCRGYQHTRSSCDAYKYLVNLLKGTT